jgi:hypothetical protein
MKVSFTPWPLYLYPDSDWIKLYIGPRAGLDAVEKYPLPCRE